MFGLHGGGFCRLRLDLSVVVAWLLTAATLPAQTVPPASVPAGTATAQATAQEQIAAEARQQVQAGQQAQTAPGQQQGQTNAARRPRRNVDQSIGSAGRRLQRTPNVIGDLPGIGNTTQFFADPQEFGDRLVTIEGGPLNQLPVEIAGGTIFAVTIPGDREALGQAFGKPLTLNFVSNDPDFGGQITGLEELSADDRRRLTEFLSRQGSVLADYTGTISESELAGLRARRTGSQTSPNGEADLFIYDARFFKGGIAPEQLVSLPRGGSMVSQHKIAEGNSPMPRDRVFFHYNQFQSVPGVIGRGNVSRFVPGFERTINDSFTSIEMRMPFAGTFDSTQTLSETASLAGGSAAELGNLAFAFKQLLYSGESLGLSAGMSLELPTADDTVIDTSAFTITRSAESVTVAPYLGFVSAPTDRLFFQGFCQVQFDTNGESVEFRDRFQQESISGRLQEAAILYTDLQSGYWLYRADAGAAPTSLTGLATLLELHLNQTLQGTDAIQADLNGVPLAFGTAGSNYGLANLTTGVTAEFNRQTNLTMAVILPLTTGDRVFDSEFHVGLNHAFGSGGIFRQPAQRGR
ncbi:MAG: hypothetical protein RLZZ436_595 [Planctomycetota bacterium]